MPRRSRTPSISAARLQNTDGNLCGRDASWPPPANAALFFLHELYSLPLCPENIHILAFACIPPSAIPNMTGCNLTELASIQTPSPSQRGRPPRDMKSFQRKEPRDELTKSNSTLDQSRLKIESTAAASMYTPPTRESGLAESNAQHHRLQKQRDIKLMAMILDTFLKIFQIKEGSNRKLLYIIRSATKLYIASLLDDKTQLQEQFLRIIKMRTRILTKARLMGMRLRQRGGRFALTKYGRLASLWRMVFPRLLEPQG